MYKQGCAYFEGGVMAAGYDDLIKLLQDWEAWEKQNALYATSPGPRTISNMGMVALRVLQARRDKLLARIPE